MEVWREGGRRGWREVGREGGRRGWKEVGKICEERHTSTKTLWRGGRRIGEERCKQEGREKG